MDKTYRIEVYLNKNNSELENSYFWRLAISDNATTLNVWYTSNSGYGKTYQDAFDQALSIYKNITKGVKK